MEERGVRYFYGALKLNFPTKKHMYNTVMTNINTEETVSEIAEKIMGWEWWEAGSGVEAHWLDRGQWKYVYNWNPFLNSSDASTLREKVCLLFGPGAFTAKLREKIEKKTLNGNNTNQYWWTPGDEVLYYANIATPAEVTEACLKVWKEAMYFYSL